MKELLIILGAGGHAREVSTVAARTGTFAVVGFLDETVMSNGHLRELPVSSDLDWLVRRCDRRPALFCGVGDIALRRRWSQEFGGRFGFARLIDPAVVLGPGVSVGTGTVVFPGAILSCDVSVGQHVIVNALASLSHDVRVGDFTNVGPACALPGHVQIGSGCELGAGVTVLPRTTVGDDCTIGAGSVLTRSLANGQLAYGVRARTRAPR